MPVIDVVQNYAEATVITSLNATDAAGVSENINVSAVAAAWQGVTPGVTQLRVMDRADQGTTNYEIMILTSNNGGAPGTWTLTRGAEGTPVKAHNANWVLTPIYSAGSVNGPSKYGIVGRLYRAAALSVASTGDATLVLDSSVDKFPVGVNAGGGITLPDDGAYRISGSVSGQATGSGQRNQCLIYQNGIIAIAGSFAQSSGPYTLGCIADDVVSGTAGDQILLGLFNGVENNWPLNVGTANVYLTVEKVPIYGQ